MAVKRKTYALRGGKVIDREEFHDGNYGTPGKPRQKREKPTKEQMRKVNAANKARRCRQRLLEYFTEDDIFATLTWEPTKRPADMREAKKEWAKFIGKVRKEYRKMGKQMFWIRNIEQGTKGAWHIHLVITGTERTASILEDAWPHGGIYAVKIRKSGKMFDEDFSRLAAYLTKDENAMYEKKDGTPGKPRVRESSYSTSRNMPLPEPKVDKLQRWQKEPKPKKGYYMAGTYEGINPVTGFRYRRYTMIRLPEGLKSPPHAERRQETCI